MNIITSLRRFDVLKKIRVPQNYSLSSRYFGGTTKPELTAASTVPQEASKVVRKRKSTNWVSYGFDFVDQRSDIMYMHSTSFFLIVVFFYGFVFILSYYPDLEEMDWSQREAHIELRRREILGLPLIDKNYIDPATVILPPDEEIGDDEIII